MKKFFLWPLLVLSLSLFGCNSNNEQGIKDSRKDFMIKLKKALNENNIPFTVDDKGYIRYSNEYKETVEQIVRKIDQSRMSEVGTKFEDEMSTQYFRKLLDERGISYHTEIHEDGEWTYWIPESKQQQEEIEMKVVKHAFKHKSERSE